MNLFDFMENRQNPWVGLSSYEDPAKSKFRLKFCGRYTNSYDVAKLVDDNFVVTLYGKSGIGKTSLMNAGVFPILREEFYTPMSIRLGMTENKDAFQDLITLTVEQTVKENGGCIKVINVVEEQKDRNTTDYLWNYFARRRFYNQQNKVTFPVIVLDQFEEVFRNKNLRDKANCLLKQIHYLADENHALDDCMAEGIEYYYDFNFRFVICIREDDLYRLEDSIDINGLTLLKRIRYRLNSLSEQGARDAILIPGEGLFKNDEEQRIADAILDKSRNEDDTISTNIVSLLCNRIFNECKKAKMKFITLALVESFIKGNPFERFYNEATKGFSDKEKSYIENYLVDSSGRRNSVPEADFLLHVPKGALLLKGTTRILQRVSTSADGENYRIELIHDSFCEPLAGLKEKRAKKRRIINMLLLGVIALTCLAVGAYVWNQNRKIENLNELLENQNKQLVQTTDSLQGLVDENGILSVELQAIRGSKSKADRIRFVSYTLDGIEFKTPYTTEKLLNDWCENNFMICKDRVNNILEENKDKYKYKIPPDMMDYHPCLVYLILKSHSIKSVEDKNEWFKLYERMNQEQIMKLYDILYAERYAIASVTFKNKAEEYNQKAYEYVHEKQYEQAINVVDSAIIEAKKIFADVIDSKGEILLMKDEKYVDSAMVLWNQIQEICPDFLSQYKEPTEFYKHLQKLGRVP